MQINQTNLDILFKAFNASFQRGFGSVPSQWGRVATMVPSTGKSNDYGWLGNIPGMREWIGDRQINNLKLHDYTLKNRSFENTISVDRDDIDDDQYGIYTPMMEMLGNSAATHPDELVFALLAAGFSTPCYDKQYFFDSDHPVVQADGTTASVSNLQAGGGNPWFLLDTRRPLKPLILQIRKRPEFVSKNDPKDDNVFNRKEYVYGVDDRKNVGFGFWQMAFGSRATLNAANYQAAYAAMAAFEGDHGKKIGIQPNLMVYGASNKAAAKTVIEAQLINGGDSNINYKEVELLEVPWLK
jgi:phage major head subunit gpT-like protein